VPSGSAAWKALVVAALEARPGGTPVAGDWSRIGGSALSSAWSLRAGSQRFFVKVAPASSADGFAAEVDGLRAIAHTGAIRVPSVVHQGGNADAAWIVLEWLDLVEGGRGAALGRALAQLHATTAPHYGWHRDNTIGATPQINGWSDDWAAFFRERRLRVQIELAARNGHSELARAGEALIERVPALLADHRPRASLLHGDLWAGNAARLRDGSPTLYDPAVYYGDAEADLAMTALFGGFDASFYEAYASIAPLADGHQRRRTLYNLYHVLNHANLFGGAYAGQAKRMIAELL
jgi:protein-ribulosamine 3-kinase